MTVTFRTPGHASVVYTESVGVSILKLMGRTGNVPGALEPGQVQAALAMLNEQLANVDRDEAQGDSPQDEPPVAAGTRAFPLIELLEAAVAAEDYVRWE